MTVNIEVRQVHADPIAVVRRRAKPDQLARVIPDACGQVWNFIRSSEFVRPGRNIAVYLDGEINLECGVEVMPLFAGREDIHLSATPAIALWRRQLGDLRTLDRRSVAA